MHCVVIFLALVAAALAAPLAEMQGTVITGGKVANGGGIIHSGGYTLNDFGGSSNVISNGGNSDIGEGNVIETTGNRIIGGGRNFIDTGGNTGIGLSDYIRPSGNEISGFTYGGGVPNYGGNPRPSNGGNSFWPFGPGSSFPYAEVQGVLNTGGRVANGGGVIRTGGYTMNGGNVISNGGNTDIGEGNVIETTGNRISGGGRNFIDTGGNTGIGLSDYIRPSGNEISGYTYGGGVPSYGGNPRPSNGGNSFWPFGPGSPFPYAEVQGILNTGGRVANGGGVIRTGGYTMNGDTFYNPFFPNFGQGNAAGRAPK